MNNDEFVTAVEKLMPIIDAMPDVLDAMEEISWVGMPSLQYDDNTKYVVRYIHRYWWLQDVLNIKRPPDWLVKLTPMWVVNKSLT